MSPDRKETILIVSHVDEEREHLAGVLRQSGYGVRVAASTQEALEAYDAEPAAVTIADRDLPGHNGFPLTGLLHARHPEAVVIILCDKAGVEDTVSLMREGAFHVLEKPPPPAHLAIVTQKALEHWRLTLGNQNLRNQLDISEKLAMIGRLASGVAHELNNPLDGVRRFIRMTHEGLESESEDLKQYCERAMSGLSRMAGIVRQLLTFSRNVVLENEAENLRTMLDEVVRTMAPGGSAGPTVELENPYVDVKVPRALFQVFVNLIKNALDAVEDQGPRGRVRVTVGREEGKVEIVVEDNGVGIKTDDLRRVFEPFFTTKEVGRGTGLGLPISARIVERCGGALRIESEEGKGTTVFVTLPLGAPKPAPALHGAEQR